MTIHTLHVAIAAALPAAILATLVAVWVGMLFPACWRFVSRTVDVVFIALATLGLADLAAGLFGAGF